MLVSHEPAFTNVVAGLTGASLKLANARLGARRYRPASEEGKLLWLFPPKIAKKVR